MEGHEENINTVMSVIVRGVAGLGMVESIPTITPDKITSIGQLVIQLIIGVVTLIGILKKSKQPSVNIQQNAPEDVQGGGQNV